jgi:hypothetical protein
LEKEEGVSVFNEESNHTTLHIRGMARVQVWYPDETEYIIDPLPTITKLIISDNAEVYNNTPVLIGLLKHLPNVRELKVCGKLRLLQESSDVLQESFNLVVSNAG